MTTSIKALKQLAAEQLEAYRATMRKIELFRTQRKEKCKHTGGFTVRTNSYCEPPMTSPTRWEEKVCKRCGKVVATRGVVETNSDWVE